MKNEFNIENLMVGDWILYLSDKQENAFPIQVTAEMFTNEFRTRPHLFDYLKLTPEMVHGEPTGFGKSLFWLDDNEKFMIKRYEDGTWYFNGESKSPFCILESDFQYVHELQHMFKMLNFNYNFKI